MAPAGGPGEGCQSLRGAPRAMTPGRMCNLEGQNPGVKRAGPTIVLSDSRASSMALGLVRQAITTTNVDAASPFGLEQVSPKETRHLTRMLIAVVAMFLQQTCGSVGRVLPAVLAPLIILELHADPSWVGVYFGLTAVAALIGQLGSGGFIIRHGAIRMSQIALLSIGGGMAVAVIGGAAGFVLSALVGNGIAAVATPASSQLLGRWAIRRYAPFAFSITQTAIPGRHPARRLAWPSAGPVPRMARHDAGQRRSLLVLRPAAATAARTARYRSASHACDPPVGLS